MREISEVKADAVALLVAIVTGVVMYVIVTSAKNADFSVQQPECTEIWDKSSSPERCPE